MALDPSERQRLQAAYERTEYRVFAPDGTMVIQVGQLVPSLDVLLGEIGVEEWAFLTAYNPRSQLLEPSHNQQRQQRLRSELESTGLGVVPGEGAGLEPGWEPEPSFLVLGLDRDSALDLARRYEQHAIVVGKRGERASLVWCDAQPSSSDGMRDRE